MSKLTERQQQVLKLIQRAIAQTGAPPTRAEIATELGFRSANAAEEHLQALSRKGVIELVSGTSRGIRLRGEALRDLNDDPDRQMMLPIAGLNQLLLPLIGRVAAGSPILAAAHVEQSYHLEPSLFQRRPDYLLKVRGMSMRDAAFSMGICSPFKQPERHETDKSSSRVWARTSQSSGFGRSHLTSNCVPKTQTSQRSLFNPMNPSISRDLPLD